MLNRYRHVLSELAGRDISPGFVRILLVIAILIPIALASGIYDPRIALGVFLAVTISIGIVLFYNVRTYSFIVLPFYFLLVFDYLFLALFALLVITFIAERVNQVDLSIKIPHPILLMVIILAGANGIVRAVDPDFGRYYFQFIIVFPIIVYLIYYNLQPTTAEMRTYLTIAAGATAIVGWISLAMWLRTGIPRQIFSWTSQNVAACFMGMLFPYAILELIDSKNKQIRVIQIFIFTGVTLGIILSQTRAVLMSIFVAMIYVAFIEKRILKILLPAIIVAGIALPGLIVYRIAILLGYGDMPDWSSVGRIQIWTNSIQYIPKYFLFGMGIESFRSLYSIDFPSSFIPAKHPHNAYLKWLFDLGLFGLIGYGLLIFGVLQRSIRAVRECLSPVNEADRRLLLAINGGFISGLTASMVDATLHHTPTALFIWTLLAFQIVIVARMRRNQAIGLLGASLNA